MLTARIAERLEDFGCRTLALTATEAGRTLYEKLGFHTETYYHGFSGPGLGSDARIRDLRRIEWEDLSAVCELDRRLTGEDRSHLLRTFEGQGWLVADEDSKLRGYHLPAPWGSGPVLVESFQAAKSLTQHVRAMPGAAGTTQFWLASENQQGQEYLRSIGFKEARRLPRMVRGEPLSWRPESLWGLFSLGKG